MRIELSNLAASDSKNFQKQLNQFPNPSNLVSGCNDLTTNDLFAYFSAVLSFGDDSGSESFNICRIDDTCLDTAFTERETQRAAKYLKNGKSAGIDGLRF